MRPNSSVPLRIKHRILTRKRSQIQPTSHNHPSNKPQIQHLRFSQPLHLHIRRHPSALKPNPYRRQPVQIKGPITPARTPPNNRHSVPLTTIRYRTITEVNPMRHPQHVPRARKATASNADCVFGGRNGNSAMDNICRIAQSPPPSTATRYVAGIWGVVRRGWWRTDTGRRFRRLSVCIVPANSLFDGS